MVDVRVVVHQTNATSLPQRALVDSGADRSVLPASIADEFGLDLQTLPLVPARGASGATQFRGWTPGASVRLIPLGVDLEVRPALFADVPVPVLGRADFFGEFRCGFDERAQQFWVERY